MVISSPHSMKQAGLAAALLALLGLMLACGSSTLLMSVSLEEEAFKAPLQEAVKAQGLNFEITQVEIVEESKVHVSGNYTPQGGESVPGSFDLLFKVEEEALKAEVTALDLPGQVGNETTASRLAEQAAEEVRRLLAEGRGEILFVEIKTRPQALQMVIRIVPPGAEPSP